MRLSVGHCITLLAVRAEIVLFAQVDLLRSGFGVCMLDH